MYFSLQMERQDTKQRFYKGLKNFKASALEMNASFD